jgi:preprotein translocase subunit SecD
MAICFVFLWPTVRWYFLTPRDQQALALESREQIKVYASRTAQIDFQRLIAIAQEDGDVPEELSFLVTQAKKIYKDSKRPAPDHWDARATLSAFNSRREALDAI